MTKLTIQQRHQRLRFPVRHLSHHRLPLSHGCCLLLFSLTLFLSLLNFAKSQNIPSNETAPPTTEPTVSPTPPLPTIVPTSSPVTTPPTSIPTSIAPTTVSPTFPPTPEPGIYCNVCGAPGYVVTNLQGFYQGQTCLQWYQQGTTFRQLTATQCTALQNNVEFQRTCDCEDPNNGNDNGVIPTAAPTTAPTQLTMIETAIVMVLENVTTAMSPVHYVYFASELATYLEFKLRPQTALGPNWQGQLESQVLLQWVPPVDSDEEDEDDTNNNIRKVRQRRQQEERQHHQQYHQHQGALRQSQPFRALQEEEQERPTITVSTPLATRTLINATQRRGVVELPSETLDYYIQTVWEQDGNGAGFLAHLLNRTSSPTLLVYFEKIRSVTIYPAATITNLTEWAEEQERTLQPESNDEDDNGFFTLWAIVGIAGGIGVCLLLTAAVLLCIMQPETLENSPRAAAGSPRYGGFSTSPTNSNNNLKNNNNDKKSSIFKDGPTTSNAPSHIANAPSGADGEDDTTYYGNASILNPPTVTPQDADNQSYAYSLEPGHWDNATILGGGQQQQQKQPERVQGGPDSQLQQQQPRPSTTTSNKAQAAATGDTGSGETTGTPSNTAATTAMSTSSPSILADDSKSIITARRGPMVTREIQAPPGKLGIVIDTSLEGPIVHKVNENSPLQGQIFTGDIITSINGIDTRAMKASAITNIMIRTAHEPRILKVASEDTTALP